MDKPRSHWGVSLLTLAALGVLLGVPFALRPAKVRLADPLRLVILSPHDEGVKAEFERAFSEWHEQRFGRPVKIEWPNLGGTGDIRRYVESQFQAEFRRAWRRAWEGDPPRQIDWAAVDRVGPAATQPDGETAARVRAALAEFRMDIDIFFGGGDYEQRTFKRNGWTAPADEQALGDYLAVVPGRLGGVELYDPDGYWFGAVLTRVGILANRVVCRQLGIAVPTTWADLARAEYRDQLALADPNFSGSARLCYEMVLQKHGWDEGWPMLTHIAANARYFGASATQVALDISRCEAAAGMIIDYYGRTQVDFVGRDPGDGEYRLVYTSPTGATATTPDPIAVMRGAPNRQTALRFVQFVLSEPGQRLWMGKVGSPGGPKRFALYRPPIRPDVYKTAGEHMIFPEDPYSEDTGFNIDARMLGRRFDFLAVLMRAAFIDNADLLRRAADRVRAADPDSPARKLFDALPFEEGDANDPPQFDSMWGRARRFREADPVDREQQADELTEFFRARYRRVIDLADGR